MSRGIPGRTWVRSTATMAWTPRAGGRCLECLPSLCGLAGVCGQGRSPLALYCLLWLLWNFGMLRSRSFPTISARSKWRACATSTSCVNTAPSSSRSAPAEQRMTCGTRAHPRHDNVRCNAPTRHGTPVAASSGAILRAAAARRLQNELRPPQYMRPVMAVDLDPHRHRRTSSHRDSLHARKPSHPAGEAEPSRGSGSPVSGAVRL